MDDQVCLACSCTCWCMVLCCVLIENKMKLTVRRGQASFVNVDYAARPRSYLYVMQILVTTWGHVNAVWSPRVCSCKIHPSFWVSYHATLSWIRKPMTGVLALRNPKADRFHALTLPVAAFISESPPCVFSPILSPGSVKKIITVRTVIFATARNVCAGQMF